MIDDVLIQRAQNYAAKRQLRLAERLGFGIHGIVYVAEDKTQSAKRAIKALRAAEFYELELEAYLRLQEADISNIRGFEVPRLLDHDDDLHVIEMTVVTRPFILDFAGAYVGRIPEFPQETWDEWEEQKRDQFGQRWPIVENVLAELRKFGIYMVDVSPSNIAFLD